MSRHTHSNSSRSRDGRGAVITTAALMCATTLGAVGTAAAVAAPPAGSATPTATTTATATPTGDPTSAPGVPSTMTEVPAGYAVPIQLRYISLAWQAAAANGSPITGYLILYTDLTHPSGSGQWTTVGPRTTDYSPQLTAGDFYVFTAAGINAVGTGVMSAPSDPIEALTAPGPATDVEVTAGNTTADLGWVLPVFDGFTPLVDPAVIGIFDLTAATETAESAYTNPFTVTNLINGHSYAFVVQVENFIGYSDTAPTAPITPGVPVVLPPTPVSAGVVSAALPSAVSVGLGPRVVPFRVDLTRADAVTVRLVHGGVDLASAAEPAREPAVSGVVTVRLPGTVGIGVGDRWVVSETTTGRVLTSRPVQVRQASSLSFFSHRSGTIVTGVGVARWADRGAGVVMPWAGHLVDVQVDTVHGWRTIQMRRTDAGGHLTVVVKVKPGAKLRLRDGATATVAGTTSAVSP